MDKQILLEKLLLKIFSKIKNKEFILRELVMKELQFSYRDANEEIKTKLWNYFIPYRTMGYKSIESPMAEYKESR